MDANRRELLHLFGAGLVAWAPAAWALKPSDPQAYAVDLAKLRALDLSPAWFTSANWANRAYDPWTDYISGEISESDFSRACSKVSDYCLRDIWNLRKAQPDPVDWDKTPPNWNGVHALALRYFRTGKPIYLKKWLAVVGDYAAWSDKQAAGDRLPTRGRQPAPLLDAAFTWGGIFTAMSIVAKALGRGGDTKASPYEPVTEPLAADQARLIPLAFMTSLGNAFVRGAGAHMAQSYADARYVPNQRVFGFEAIALACVYFSQADPVNQLRPTLDDGVADAIRRYRQLDGGQLEQSFNYARDVVDGLARMQRLPLAPAPAWRGAAADTVTAWERFTQAIALPRGGLPQLGNAATGRIATGSDLRFATASIAFPYSGVYCQRSAWAPDAAYLFFFARRLARGHSMAGSNSVQVHAFGQPLITAGGSADYRPARDGNRASAAYLSESSSWKTSTILVDGLSQKSGSTDGLPRDDKGQPDITRVPTQPIRARWHASDTLDYLEGLYDAGYQRPLAGEGGGRQVDDVRHWRQVVFVRPMMLWLVVDVLRSEASHRYTQVWKLAPPGSDPSSGGFVAEQVQTDAREGLLRTTRPGDGAANLSLHHFSSANPQWRKYFGSDGFGYHSRGPVSEAEPAVDVHVEWEGRGPQVCITAIVPQRGAAAVLSAATNRSRAGVAACELTSGAGFKLAAAASASATSLSAASVNVPRAELLVVLQAPGQGQPTRLVISPDDSHVLEGSRKSAIVEPTTFRWTEGAGGALSPVYRT
jgi:hypothetical protein